MLREQGWKVSYVSWKNYYSLDAFDSMESSDTNHVRLQVRCRMVESEAKRWETHCDWTKSPSMPLWVARMIDCVGWWRKDHEACCAVDGMTSLCPNPAGAFTPSANTSKHNSPGMPIFGSAMGSVSLPCHIVLITMIFWIWFTLWGTQC